MIKPSTYVLGTAPPVLKPDAGAGPWGSKQASLGMKALKGVLTTEAIQSLAGHFGGVDAVHHLAHFFENDGKPYTIAFQKLINEAPTAKKTFELQLEAARSFVAALPLGRSDFTSSTGSLNHNIGMRESKNWFFAVHSYTSWGRGTALVEHLRGKRQFTMTYEYHFFDRYNWDGGKHVEIPIPLYEKLPSLVQSAINSLPNVKDGQLTVTDKFMAEFHLQGLAREFDSVAMIRVPTQVWSVYSTVHKVAPGETLAKIALKYYGDPTKWPLIHAANKAKIPNPNLVLVGQELTIPY